MTNRGNARVKRAILSRCNLRSEWAAIPDTRKFEGTRQIVAKTESGLFASRRYNNLMVLAELLTNRAAFQGLISLIFGLLVLMFPKILNYLIAFYFIITGLTAILPFLH